jgi:indole-3-glycerol phosphate synthase
MTAQVAPVLARIVERRRQWVDAVNPAERASILDQAQTAPPARDFAAALSGTGVALIAECKARSPSAGTLQDPYDPAGVARRFEAGGADAISVLTEPESFGGRFEHLRLVRQAVALPILCKDFVIDELQLACARSMGADAALLIVAILDDVSLHRLHQAAGAIGLQALVEVHTEAELERALSLRPRLIGINNRDLNAMRTDPGTTARLRPLIPAGHMVVSESGLRERSEIESLEALGVDAALVGEALLRSRDPEAMLRRLRGR